MHTEHLSPVMFSDLQEHIPPGELQFGDKKPCSSQSHAKNIINKPENLFQTMTLQISLMQIDSSPFEPS